MTRHDHFAAHQLINRYWFNYDQGHLDVCEQLLTEDCHLSSRTELGTHPHEEFIRSDSHGRDNAMAWTRQHRAHSPYRIHRKEVVLDSIESAPFQEVDFVAPRARKW